MTTTMTRKASLVALAGTMVLGMSACTSVEGSADTAKSSATSAASDDTSSGSSATESAKSETSDSASQSSSETSSPSSDSSSESSTSSESTDGGDSASGPKVGKVGQEVKTDKMSVKVSKINESVKSTSDYQKPDAGKHWVGVNISVTNLADKELSFSSSCVKVRLTDNTSPMDDYVDYGNRLGYGSLYKGDTSTGDLVYQVSSGQKIKSIDVDCSYGDDQAVRIQAD